MIYSINCPFCASPGNDWRDNPGWTASLGGGIVGDVDLTISTKENIVSFKATRPDGTVLVRFVHHCYALQAR